MSYIPHTDTDRAAMLKAVGVTSLEGLFEAVPPAHRFPKLDLPEALSELEIVRELSAVASYNAPANELPCFLGAGAYYHFSPAIINHLILRGEFLTAYTPYQPEVSQGTLQAIYEFQSMICTLMGMEAANASHYDGATSLAEAITMALEVGRGKRKKIVMSPHINPMYRDVALTYHQFRDLNFVGHRGSATIHDLADMVDDKTALAVVQYPDFLGQVKDFSELAAACKKNGALLCIIADPIACGMFKSPGSLGADIVVGEGQSLGVPMSFGGPYVGFFSCKLDHVRKIAGRIVGESVDKDGRRAFVMTLRPREQDIRREKATSNICTNQGLMALVACMYMSTLGKSGMRKVAELCWHKSHYAADQIDKVKGYSVKREEVFFKEFVISCPLPVAEINELLLHDYNLIGGYDLGKDFPGREKDMLLCVTEMISKDDIDALAEALGEIAKEN